MGLTGFTPNVTEGREIAKQDPVLQQDVKDVYIGVFFDGTNNNMVKKLDELRDKKGKKFNRFSDKEAVEEANVYNKLKPKPNNGYSNVSILYSIFEDNTVLEKGDAALYHHLYIEGAGALDKSKLGIIPNNINGLGFGLGDAGVTALVSKAVKYICRYINSVKAKLANPKDVNIHFVVIGFSRGSACARLFSYLVAREVDETLGFREKEFSKYYAKNLFYGNKVQYSGFSVQTKKPKLHFLDEFPNKTVDFLGIYDTVVSIGFLKQKDGWTHPLSNLYKGSEEYNDNWHYNNVTEYGMFSPQLSDKVKETCHICALDEFRENFALTDVGKVVPPNCMEIFIPGCHSDVGGGYYDQDKTQEFLLRTHVYRENPSKDIIDNKKAISKTREFGVTVFLENPQKKPTFKIINMEEINKDNQDNSSRVSVKDVRVKEKKGGYKEYPNLLSLESLANLGWIDRNYRDDKLSEKISLDKYNEKTGKLEGSESVPATVRVMDSERAIFKRDALMFKKNTKSGYSNIPLKMLYERMKYIKTEINIGSKGNKIASLFKSIPIEYRIPDELIDMGNHMIDFVGDESRGERRFLIPSGGYSGENYRKLRLKYLHFTSTENLIGHFNAPWEKDVKKDSLFKSSKDKADFLEWSLANIANVPNRDLEGRICRIVYHGDKGDNSLNYMYDYDKDAIFI